MAVIRNRSDGVTMAHPHLRIFVETLEQRIVEIDRCQVDTTVFSRTSLFHPTTIFVRYVLRTIANAQDRHFADKLTQIDLKGFWVMY